MSDSNTTGDPRALADGDAFDANDPHEAEKLARAGRDDSPKDAFE